MVLLISNWVFFRTLFFIQHQKYKFNLNKIKCFLFLFLSLQLDFTIFANCVSSNQSLIKHCRLFLTCIENSFDFLKVITCFI